MTVEGKKVTSATILYAFLPSEYKDQSHEDVVIKEWEEKVAKEAGK